MTQVKKHMGHVGGRAAQILQALSGCSTLQEPVLVQLFRGSLNLVLSKNYRDFSA